MNMIDTITNDLQFFQNNKSAITTTLLALLDGAIQDSEALYRLYEPHSDLGETKVALSVVITDLQAITKAIERIRNQ